MEGCSWGENGVDETITDMLITKSKEEIEEWIKREKVGKGKRKDTGEKSWVSFNIASLLVKHLNAGFRLGKWSALW